MRLLAKVRKKDRKVVAHDMRRVFYAADALSAKRALERFGCK
jgi:transposase-like protein